MQLIIVGGGATGLSLARLMDKESRVTLIEKDASLAKQVATQTNALVINGDGTDISILREAGAAKADALVVTTGDDTVNLMISQIGTSEKIPKIIPLVKKPTNEELFVKLGISSFVSVTGSNVSEIKRLLRTYGEARVIATFGEGDVQIIQQAIDEKSKLVGKPVRMKRAVIATIYREGKINIPTENSVFAAGDVLLVAVKTKDLRTVLKIIRGE